MKKLNAVILAILISVLTFPPVFSATTGVQIEFLLSQVRNATGSLAGGHVHFYAAGTTTNKDVYLDINKVSTAANPYTLDANGTAQLYGDGTYRVVIQSAAGVTVYDRDNLKFEDLATDFINSEYTMTLKPLNLTGDTTGTIQGYKLGAAGYTDNIRANYADINYGRFKLVPYVDVTHPSYGADKTGAADSSAAFIAAEAALPSTGGEVYIPAGAYITTTAITPTKNNVHYRGAGMGTIIKPSGILPTLFDLSGTASTQRELCKISNLQMQVTTATSPFRAVRFGQGSWRNRMDHVLIIADNVVSGQTGVQFNASTTNNNGVYWNVLTDVRVMYFDIGFDLSNTGTTAQQNNNKFIASQARDGNIGWRIGSATSSSNGNILSACSADGHDQYGIDVFPEAVANVVNGMYLEGDAGSIPVRFQVGSRENSFSNLILASATGLNSITDNGTRNSYEASTIDVTDATTYTVKKEGHRLKSVAIRPTDNTTEVLHVMSPAGDTYLDFSMNSTPRLEIQNGSNFIVYSDNNFTTETFKVVGASGLVRMPKLPTDNSAGSGYLWYSTSDNTVKYQP